jgi:hypothetical protein
MMHGSIRSVGSAAGGLSAIPSVEDLRSMDVAPAGPKSVAQLARVAVPPVGP